MIRIFAIAALVALVGCAPTADMQGIGRGTDDYKKSPCACGPFHPPKASMLRELV